MANNYFKEQYEESPQIRKGIDAILKSDKYTDEYKEKIHTYLKGIDVSAFSKEDRLSVTGSDAPTKITLSTRQGSSGGYIEKPTYIEDELKKALDVVVDELITLPPEQKPLTVLKSKYDAKVDELANAITELTDLTETYNDALSDIENLKLEIESLNQVVDANVLLTAVANNETDAANDRHFALLQDFQTALQKGIQEAIARVSLEAQVRGLTAQKEVLNSLLIVERANVETQIRLAEQAQDAAEYQQEQAALALAATQEQVNQAELLQSAVISLDGIPGTFAKGTTSGFKYAQSTVVPDKVNKGVWLRTSRSLLGSSNILGYQASIINIYNFRTDGPQTFTLSVDGGNRVRTSLKIPASITIPAREGVDAGVGYVTFQWVNDKLGGEGDSIGILTIRGTNDAFQIPVRYEKKNKRNDNFGTRGRVGVYPGQEKD